MNKFIRNRPACYRCISLIIFLVLIFSSTVQAQVSVTNDSLQIPSPVRVDRDGRQPLPAVDRFFYLDDLAADTIKNVFDAPPCLEGDYYAGFQLYYDLGDHNTTQNWTCQMEVALLHGEETLWTKPLAVNMADQTFIATVFHDSLISCDGDYRFHIKSKNINSGAVPAPESNILLRVLLFKKTENTFQPADEVELNCSHSNGLSSLSWTYEGEATEYDLEWIFIEAHENFTGTTPQEAFQFKEPVRVTVAIPYYTHLTYYPDGQLWYRVRAVGYNPQYPDHRILGHWFYSPCAAITINNHEEQKNWQLQTVFAEEGKYKKIMQYYDGSLRQRQSQTNLSSDNTTLVGEALYDFEGRRSVDMLAVPVMQASLSYRPAFNVFDATDPLVESNTSATHKKFHYDNRRAANSIIANTGGAGKYYSNQNNTNSIHKDFIPDAEGYVYSQTEYLNDGTGRVARQSGVGKEFKQDGEHTTRYFYGGATKSELIRLFGTNVGNASHYKKNLVVDPNEQVSVSYLDQEGRVIATALAGEKPENVDPLESYTNLPLTPVTEKLSDKNHIENGNSVTHHNFLNVAPNTEYTFRYDLSALASDIEAFGCQDCTFDLNITLTDPEGRLVELPDSIPGNEAADSFHYQRLNLTAACDDPLLIDDIEFMVTLADIGDYTITKTLVPHDLSFEQMKTVLEQDSATQVMMQQIRDSYVADPADCEICTTTCPEAETYIEEAIDEIATLDCENVLRQIEQHYYDQNPNNPDFTPTQQQIQSHPLYCKYLLCGKNKESDAFEKRLTRIPSWSTAVANGKSNPINADPFFNHAALSGYNYKGNMQNMLNDISLGTIKFTTYDGTISEVTDPANTAFYVNGSGDHDPINGKHILYLDLMSRRSELGETAYQVELDKQRWTMYRSFYLEAKRQIKLSIGEYQDCAPAIEELKPFDNLASYEEEDVKQWGNDHGWKDSVSVAELEMALYSITNACDTTLTSQDSTTVMNHLEAYFNSGPQNFLRLIHTEDVGSDSSLLAIDNILSHYGCALDSVALANLMSCVRDTTIYIPNEILYPQSLVSKSSPLSTSLKNLSDSSSIHFKDFSDQRKGDILKNWREESMQKAMGYRQTAEDEVAALMENQALQEMNESLALQRANDTQKQISTQSMLASTQEYDALMAFYNATGGPNWTNASGWGVDNPASTPWHGVIVNGQGNVIGLQLNSNNLVGYIPDEIGQLEYLQYLYISGNNLNNSIPEEIGNLNNLQQFFASNSNLTGPIPDEITELTNLQYLDLAYNQLSGTIPTDIGDLKQLVQFSLSGNSNITGTLPSSIGNLTNLVNLNIQSTKISGSIPPEMGDMTNLQYLFMCCNQLTGTIPPELGDLENLTQLDLWYNKLSGTLPVELSQLYNLESLFIGYMDSISGPIPPEYGLLSNLKFLRLPSNNLTDSIPSTLGALQNLRDLELEDNELTGPIPPQLGSLLNLRNLTLYSNNLTGSIPEELGDLTAMVRTGFSNGWLLLDDNDLEGNIPASLGDLTMLGRLGVSLNRLSGDIPDEIIDLKNMSYALLLNDNQFTFQNFLRIKQGFNGTAQIFYSPQDSIDVEKNIMAFIGQPLTLTTQIDRNTTPPSKYQWFKYVNGVNDIPLIAQPSESGHTHTIPSITESDIGTRYYYKITNPDAPVLTLVSRLQTLELFDGKALNLCLEIDSTNTTLQQFTYEVNINDLIQQCMEQAAQEDSILTEYAINRFLEEKATAFYNEFKTKCLQGVTENLQYTYTPKEYHYTLYYYDQATNLVQTVPPNGVTPLTPAQVANFSSTPVDPAHTLITRYQYNSLNQLIWQKTPDAGQSQFWYNDKGQLRLSQNAQQHIDTLYSYTKYDEQGRIVEVGELSTATPLEELLTKVDSSHFPMINGYWLSDITRTHYDFANQFIEEQFTQNNLRTRVAWVEVIDKNATDTIATYYSYDIHGNVKSLLQHVPGLDDKRTDYAYDLISGKVNYIFYQYDKPDQFIHKYNYDSDNRIVEALTSTDGFVWDKDASYYYYAHGPLARVELGEHRVQGMDYYYTLQGWIKGVNMPYEGDPGEDGINSVSGKDVFAYSLGYYNTDYKAINNSVTLTDTRDHLWTRLDEVNNHTGLYNGNISWMVTDLAKIGEINNDRMKGMQAMLYQYDQLHRIVKSRSLTNYSASNGFTKINSAYDEDYTYDANGNLLMLHRRNHLGDTLHNFNYQYYPGTNKLRQVGPPEDMVFNGGAVVSNNKLFRKITVQGNAYIPQGRPVELRALEDIEMDPDFESPEGTDFWAHIVDDEGMYQYDAIGNLILDQHEGVRIFWTPYGKVREVRAKNDSLITAFRYDGAGNRIEKRVTRKDSVDIISVTHYVRDASGNVMGVYKDSLMIEQYIYGSSRLGLYKGGRYNGQRSLGEKNYELSNHLGNVLTVITDNIGMNSTDSVWASVVSAIDYYPFGLEMQDRTWTDSTSVGYRFAFNSKEKDDNGEWGNVAYDYGYRIYDPVISRFKSRDPLTASYPMLTPYQFAGNMPIAAIDLDGLEALITVTGKYWLQEIHQALKDEDVERVVYLATKAANTGLHDLRMDKDRSYAIQHGGWVDGRPAHLTMSSHTGLIIKDGDGNVLGSIPLPQQASQNESGGSTWDRLVQEFMEMIGFAKALNGGGGYMFYTSNPDATGIPIGHVRKGQADGAIDVKLLMDAISVASSAATTGAPEESIKGIFEAIKNLTEMYEAAEKVRKDVIDPHLDNKAVDGQEFICPTCNNGFPSSDTTEHNKSLGRTRAPGGYSPSDKGDADRKVNK